MNPNILKLLVVDNMRQESYTRSPQNVEGIPEAVLPKPDMKPPRSVTTVIPKLLEVIPSNETALIKEIADYYNSLWNIAPELLTDGCYWQPLGHILQTNIQSVDEPWQQQLQKIFNDNL